MKNKTNNNTIQDFTTKKPYHLNNLNQNQSTHEKSHFLSWDDLFGPFFKDMKDVVIKTKKNFRFKNELSCPDPLKNQIKQKIPKLNLDGIKNYSQSNPYFNQDFNDYIDGKIQISDLIQKNNFPSERNFEREYKLRSNEKKKTEIKTSRNINVDNAIDKLKNVIHEKVKQNKINRNDKLKNLTFFKNFYDISNHYIHKIFNGDLFSENNTKKYYLRDSTLEKNLKQFKICREKIISKDQSIKSLKENNKFYENLLKNEMKLSAENFIEDLTKEKITKEFFKKKVLKKEIERNINKEIITSNSNLEKETLLKNNEKGKRRILTNYDIALYEYLLHSKTIDKCKEYNENKVHLKNFLEENENNIKTIRKSSNNYLKIPHVVFSQKQKIDKKHKNEKIDIDSYYYRIKRNTNSNIFNKREEKTEEIQEDDESLISMTEVTLDRLYSQSINLQKKLVFKKKEKLNKRLKDFTKLDEVNDNVIKTINNKLSYFQKKKN